QAQNSGYSFPSNKFRNPPWLAFGGPRHSGPLVIDTQPHWLCSLSRLGAPYPSSPPFAPPLVPPPSPRPHPPRSPPNPSAAGEPRLFYDPRFSEHAEAFFRESVIQFDVSAKTYTILISGWAVVMKPANARNLFDEMIERGIEPDVPAYNALIDALCRGGDVALAQQQLKDMQRGRGLVPDAATYGPFLRSACASKDARAALRVLDRMRARDLTPNVFTYNAVIRLLCELGEVDEAYTIMNEMATHGEKPDVWSYNTLLNTHCKLKEVNKALRLISRMDEDSCLPDRHSYNMILKMLIGVGRVDRAIEVWDGMEKHGFHPGAATYAVMIHGLSCKKGRAEEACSYFIRMVDEGIPPYQATCQVLRDRLLRLGLRNDLEANMDSEPSSQNPTDMTAFTTWEPRLTSWSRASMTLKQRWALICQPRSSMSQSLLTLHNVESWINFDRKVYAVFP
ncbi:hypothetical protein U9M48_014271, partial [Paspalum notatum var. saurae]